MTLGLSAIIAWIFVGLILPLLVETLKPSLAAWELLSTTTFMAFLGLSLSFIVSLVALVYLSQQLKFSSFVKFALLSFALSLIGICLICYLIVIVLYPQYYSQIAFLNRMLALYNAPAVLTLKLGTIEPIWIGGSFLYYCILIGGFSNVKSKN